MLSLSLSHTGHWKFNMTPHGKELSEDLKKRIAALHKDDVGYTKIAETLKLSCSTVAKTIQRFNRTGSTQNMPRHGRPKKLSAHAQRHIQRLCLGNRRMSAASIAAEVEGLGGGVSLSVLRHWAATDFSRTRHQVTYMLYATLLICCLMCSVYCMKQFRVTQKNVCLTSKFF